MVIISGVPIFRIFTVCHLDTCKKKFKELKPVLSSRHLSFKTHGRVYSMCVRSAMLHASETWPVTKPCLQHLQGNDRVMIRQTCNVKPQDTVTIRSIKLLSRLGIEEVQGAETSSLFPPPFFQDTWPCVQHVCAERNAPCQ